MIKTRVIDNWLEPQLADFLSDYLHKGIMYQAGHGSNKEDNTSFLFGIVPLSSLTDFLIYKLKFIRPIEVLRIYTNLHYKNMGGNFHIDDGDITFLYMPSKGLNSKEGSFIIKTIPGDKDSPEEKIEYRFNRLIYFNAKQYHKGEAPVQNIPRITLAFKTKSLTIKA
jgi:hypothetical protein